MRSGTVVPAFLDDGTWSACFGLSYMALTMHDMLSSRRIVREGGTYLRKVAGTAGIPDGRNECVINFLDHTDGEWLFMVDTDMGFSPETVDRLVSSADRHMRPVMGALAFAQRKTGSTDHYGIRMGVIPTIYDYAETDDGEVGFIPRADYARDQVIEASATGAACLLINRTALVKVRDRYGDIWFDTIRHPTALRGKPRSFSEDLSFCVRLSAVGVPIHIDTSVKTIHEKGGIFLDEDLYLEQQERSDHATVRADH